MALFTAFIPSLVTICGLRARHRTTWGSLTAGMIYILACTLHLRGISPSSRVSCACDALRLILLFYVLNLWRLTVSSRLSIPSRCKWIHNATQCTLLYSGAGRPCRGAA